MPKIVGEFQETLDNIQLSDDILLLSRIGSW